ncbi:multiheme c-type cytochrome [Hydrogenimonas sp.]
MKWHRYKKIVLLTVSACILGIGGLFLLIPTEKLEGVEVKDVPFYSTPWGEDQPFFPGQIQTADGKLGDPKKIPSSSECVTCHKKEFEEWVPSLHSISGRDIVYDQSIELNVNIKKRHHGRELARFCDSCHNPMEVSMGRINPIQSVEPSDVQTEGLACVFCHTATHADAQTGNGAITFDLNKAHDNLSGAAILASPKDHARAFGAKATKELLTRSEFCGACHNERYYPPVTPSNRVLKAQNTFDEWKESWYAQNDVTCQDCHMNYDPIGFIENLQKGIVRKPQKYSHNFWGGNHVLQDTSLKEVLLYLRGGVLPGVDTKRYYALMEKQHAVTEKFLRAAAKVEIVDVNRSEKGLTVAVRVSNVGAGHNLPTGVVDQKHMWLQLKAQAPDGEVIYNNGASDRDENVTIWAERFLDKKGKVIMDHLTFKTHDIVLTRPTIPPRGSQTIVYHVPLPAGAESVKLTANLWYKIAYEELIVSALHQSIPIPKFRMATQTKEWHETAVSDSDR